MFTGEIYLHRQEPDGRVTSHLLPTDPFPYDELSGQSQRIARSTGQPYLILYSRARLIETEDGSGLQPWLEPIVYQTQEGEEVVQDPVGITQVDILPLIEPSWGQLISTLRTWQNLPLPQHGQGYLISGRHFGRSDILEGINALKRQPINIARYVSNLHYTNGTPFYQRQMARLI